MEAGARQLDHHLCSRGQRSGAVAREAALLDRLDAERLERAGGDARRSVLEEQVHLVRRLVDRQGERGPAGGQHVAVRELPYRTGGHRSVQADEVAPAFDGVGGEIACPNLKLQRARGEGAGPHRPQGVGCDAGATVGVGELEDLEHIARAVVLGSGDRDEPATQVDGHAGGPGDGVVHHDRTGARSPRRPDA